MQHSAAAAGVGRRGRAAALLVAAFLVAAFLAAALLAAPAVQAQFWSNSKPMPEFANQAPAVWINSKPLSKADLAGKVVLIEVWTSI